MSTELPNVSAVVNGEEKVVFSLPQTPCPKIDSVLWFCLPKSGNIMLSKMLSRLSLHLGMQPIFVEGNFWEHGLVRSDIPAETSKIFLPKGYCYGSSLWPEEYEIPLLGTSKTLVHVRDIRDVLVSLYYSVRNSHPEPGHHKDDNGKVPLGLKQFRESRARLEATEIDKAVINMAERGVHRLYHRMMKLAQSYPVLVTRYEDVVYDKKAWLQRICDHFDWNISESFLTELAAEQDIFPDKETSDSHVRQVHPGNFRNKLAPETIQTLDRIFEEEQAFFGYAPERSI